MPFMWSQNRLLFFCLVLSICVHSLLFLPARERSVKKRVYSVDVIFEKKAHQGQTKGPFEKRPLERVEQVVAPPSPLSDKGAQGIRGPGRVEPLVAKELQGQEEEPVVVPPRTEQVEKGIPVTSLERPLQGEKGEEGGSGQLVGHSGEASIPSKGAVPLKGLNESSGPSIRQLVMPKYPESARKLGKEGFVLLRVLIDEKGTVRDVQIIKSAGYEFDEEAKRAIRSSLFNPAHENGVPTLCYVDIPVRFVLRDRR